MTFREAIAPYFDGDHLIARVPNPTTLGTEGNPVLETGNAYAILKWRNELTGSDRDSFFNVMTAIEKVPGLPNKKFRSTDMVTHDDLIGYVAGSVALNCQLHFDLYVYGLRNGWNLTNNSDTTWESEAKPWHIAFYTIAANQKASFFGTLALAGSVLWNAFIGMEDASGKRLMYLMLKTIKGKNLIIDLAGIIWLARIRRVYGSAKRIFIMLKGEQHPFSVYCPD